MSTFATFCPLNSQIESCVISDIVLFNATETDGQFIPGNAIDQKTLRVFLQSDCSFPPFATLRLQLVATIDVNGIKKKLNPPVCVENTLSKYVSTVKFDLVSSTIPLPKGYTYLANTQTSCAETLKLEYGDVQKYVFLLTTKTCRTGPYSCPGIPFVARVLNGANCDIKCEKPETQAEPDDNHPLKIFCQDTKTFVYSTQPHCVTHCQAPKPLFLFYEYQKSRTVVGQNVCHTCN